MSHRSVTSSGEIRGVGSLSVSHSAPAHPTCSRCGGRLMPDMEDDVMACVPCGHREWDRRESIEELMAEATRRQSSRHREPQPGAWRGEWRNDPAQLALFAD